MPDEEGQMPKEAVQKASNQTLQKAKLATMAEFPREYFLENLAVRSDNSMLITVLNRGELWFIPSPSTKIPVEPAKLYTFPILSTGIVETEPDIFYISTVKFYNSDEAFLQRLDLRGWVPGAAVKPEQVFQFPKNVRALNGSCLVGPNVILLADSFAGLIWRVDLPNDGGTPVARIWLQHESMGYYPGQLKPEQPGVNGIRYAAKLGCVYYTATAKKLFMRVQVHPETLDAVGEPEHVSAGRMADDFCIDDNETKIRNWPASPRPTNSRTLRSYRCAPGSRKASPTSPKLSTSNAKRDAPPRWNTWDCIASRLVRSSNRPPSLDPTTR
jgi:hypothetical protein